MAVDVPLAKKLSQIPVDDIRFDRASIQDALSSLEQVSREQDPDGAGVRLTYVEMDGGDTVRPITLHLKKTNVADVLKVIAGLSGLMVEENEQGALLKRK